MRRVRFLRSASVAGALVLAAAGCGGGDGDGADPVVGPTTEAGPTTPPTLGRPTVLAIVAPATGDQVAGNVVRLDLTSSGITIAPANGDTSGATGHYHVFVDREAVEPGEVIPVAADIVHTAQEPIVIPGLSVGPHRIVVAFGDGAHRRLGVTEAGTSFTVTGPSVDASTPPNAPAGQPVTVTVVAEGLSPDGHLHLFADREPTPTGQPVPDEPGIIHATGLTVAVPDLAPGTHTIWVVAGDAAHVPLDPLVMDKVTVTVG
jgi:hypothetical protein